ncbi:acidic leucine-rich nuclear phosphoprotein 32 mapmodulin isoform X1 [Arctopsyche grandis]|uniref:acidic leucine-rich nuclear phosphoprotein 32 mapmodulin isoform X1 n=1 Tax=Arctopsyche grandis TaxID=121162 RepID=UPI00406D6FD4
MEKRIALERRGRDPAQVIDLNLDNCRSPAIIGLTDEYVNLGSLSLINVGLLSLKGFPKLPNLKRLELSDNRICQKLDRLNTSPKLTHLNLSGNKISDIATLEPLKEFKKLKNLDLFNNDVTNVDEYRSKVFNLIPSLKCLDGYDKHDREAEDSEDDELNGNNESSEEDEDSDDEEEGDMPLRSLYNDKLEVEGSGSDFEVDEYGKNGSDCEEEDDEEWAEEEEEKEGENQTAESESTRGKKRKHEDSEPNN